jgi:hypothetical protein
LAFFAKPLRTLRSGLCLRCSLFLNGFSLQDSSSYNPIMWPKAISQLIELAPHVARLLPMADRFFQSKTADSEASRTAMEQMAEGLRGDLGQVTASHAGLYRQLNEQSERLSSVATDARAAMLATESIETRLNRIEARISTVFLLMATAFFVLAVILILLVLIFLHLHAA